MECGILAGDDDVDEELLRLELGVVFGRFGC